MKKRRIIIWLGIYRDILKGLAEATLLALSINTGLFQIVAKILLFTSCIGIVYYLENLLYAKPE